MCVCAYLSPLLLSLADGQLDLVELGGVVRLPGLQLVVKRDHLLKQNGMRKHKIIQYTVSSHQLLPDKLLLFILSIWKGIKGKVLYGIYTYCMLPPIPLCKNGHICLKKMNLYNLTSNLFRKPLRTSFLSVIYVMWF